MASSGSLVVRLTAVVAGIVVVAFAAGAVIVHRSTAATYRQVQREVRVGGGPAGPTAALAARLDEAWRQGRWEAVRASARHRGSAADDPGFVVLDPDNRIAAASSPEWQQARVRPGASGSYTVTMEARRGASLEVRELATTGAAELRDDAGVWGRLIVLPQDAGRDAEVGQAFAARFWRTATAWLAGVLLAAVAGIVWVMRRSLAPVTILTRAARELQAGAAPAPLRADGPAEFRELIEAFNAAAASIARTEQLRRDLISDIAHELRTPLTNIRGQLEALQQGLLRTDNEFSATMQGEVRILERLVSDVHQLALSDAGQLSLHLQPLPLRDTLEQVARPLTEMSGGTVTIDGSAAVWAVADEERLRQVVANLVENAARHRPVGLAVVITVASDDRWATFTVQDNGPGVAQADRSHIFERFYRAEKSRNRATGGAGLGLTIVDGLIRAMGGSIRYDAVDGAGATFVVTLPRSQRPA